MSKYVLILFIWFNQDDNRIQESGVFIDKGECLKAGQAYMHDEHVSKFVCMKYEDLYPPNKYQEL